MLKVEGLRAGYGSTEIVHGVTFSQEAGTFTCIMGANGCGKTTTIKTILNILKPLGGKISLDGEDVFSLDAKRRAQLFAYIPQTHTPPFPYTVADVVLLGRTPYLGSFTVVREHDREVAYRAICSLGIEHLHDKIYTELSGGQQQLVLIARALAQEPQILIMDEPTASLDFGNQQLVLSRMRRLTQNGTSVLMITHDPSHAFYCADEVVLMESGRIIGEGTPDNAMTEDALKRMYGQDICLGDVALPGGRHVKVCVPLFPDKDMRAERVSVIHQQVPHQQAPHQQNALLQDEHPRDPHPHPHPQASHPQTPHPQDAPAKDEGPKTTHTQNA